MVARLLIALTLTAAVPGALQGPPDTVTGTLTYRERVALTPDAVAEITLEDVSRADAASTVVARTRVEPVGQVPIRFELPYDHGRIDPSHRYAVRARILEGERLAFLTASAAPVLTQGHESHVDLVLTRAAAPRASTTPAPVPPAAPTPLPMPVRLTGLPATFTGLLPCADCQGIRYQLDLFDDDSFVLRRTHTGKSTTPVDDLGSWALSSDRRVLILKGTGEPELFGIRDNQTLRKLDLEGREIKSAQPYDLRRATAFQPVDLRATLRGAFRTTPDGSTFTECTSGQRWPVAADGASKDLDAAYRDARRKPGDALMVTVTGHLATRPRLDGGGIESSLVVDTVTKPAANEACAPRFASLPLEGTYWRLTRLGDTALAAPAASKNEPYLTFQDDEPRFFGSSGCNRVIGTYTKGLDTMSLSAGGTMKACASGMDTEAAVFAALRQVQAYRILGDVLELQDNQRRLVARFEAKPRKQ